MFREHLAKDRQNEEKLFALTGRKMKIVEKAGRKLVDLLTRKDPWKGEDCQRDNCLLCMTKVITNKEMQKDCTKRNLIYEVKCLTCEDEAIRKAEEETGDDLEKLREAKRRIKNHVYYGETHRSAFERGFERLQDMARLSEKSHMMLKHMVYYHVGEDFSQVKVWHEDSQVHQDSL